MTMTGLLNTIRRSDKPFPANRSCTRSHSNCKLNLVFWIHSFPIVYRNHSKVERKVVQSSSTTTVGAICLESVGLTAEIYLKRTLTPLTDFWFGVAHDFDNQLMILLLIAIDLKNILSNQLLNFVEYDRPTAKWRYFQDNTFALITCRVFSEREYNRVSRSFYIRVSLTNSKHLPVSLDNLWPFFPL